MEAKDRRFFSSDGTEARLQRMRQNRSYRTSDHGTRPLSRGAHYIRNLSSNEGDCENVDLTSSDILHRSAPHIPIFLVGTSYPNLPYRKMATSTLRRTATQVARSLRPRQRSRERRRRLEGFRTGELNSCARKRNGQLVASRLFPGVPQSGLQAGAAFPNARPRTVSALESLDLGLDGRKLFCVLALAQRRLRFRPRLAPFAIPLPGQLLPQTIGLSAQLFLFNSAAAFRACRLLILRAVRFASLSMLPCRRTHQSRRIYAELRSRAA
ncbi:hypothetical protein GGD64_002116 [Bradyrhizobium sp. CIR3A]|nr:hypothetical protein [Bradyrhizobium sp. CIR3A]